MRGRRALFGFINLGNAALGIHAYNGGLFADDPVLDSLKVSDEVCGYFRDLGSYDYRTASEALTPEEVALMWQTAPPRMPFAMNDAGRIG